MIMIPATGLLAFLAVLYCGFLIVRGMAEGLPEVKSYAVESCSISFVHTCCYVCWVYYGIIG
jgi:hypothetical protein